jgi:hypothetical protein
VSGISLLSDRAPKLRRFSEELADQIDGWFESRPTTEKSLLSPEQPNSQRLRFTSR